MKVIGYIRLTLLFRQEGCQIVGFCKELGTSGYGNNLNEAIECLEDLVRLHLNALEETGERRRFFKERNIVIQKVKPKPQRLPIPEQTKGFRYAVMRPHIQSIQAQA